jgi:hypothetical protein
LSEDEQRRSPDEAPARVEREAPVGPGFLAILALSLISASVFFPFAWVLGILIAWVSRSWFVVDKVVATLIPILGFLLFMATSVAITTTTGQITGVAPEGSDRFQQLLGVGLATYGLIGAPLSAAIYLGLRLRPRPRRLLFVIGALLAFAVLFALLIVLFQPTGIGDVPVDVQPVSPTPVPKGG